MFDVVNKPCSSPFPLQLRADLTVNDAADLANVVMAESDGQVTEKKHWHREDADEYRFACDSLNVNRVILRLNEERWNSDHLQNATKGLINHICNNRGYEAEEFEIGIEATRERARYPFGLAPLAMAMNRAAKEPLKLKVPELSRYKAATLIASLAYHLQKIAGNHFIILPVDHVRKLLGMRKLVASETIKSLVKAGVLECTNAVYFTGHARHFRFVGQAGRHYESEGLADMKKQEEILF